MLCRFYKCMFGSRVSKLHTPNRQLTSNSFWLSGCRGLKCPVVRFVCYKANLTFASSQLVQTSLNAFRPEHDLDLSFSLSFMPPPHLTHLTFT